MNFRIALKYDLGCEVKKVGTSCKSKPIIGKKWNTTVGDRRRKMRNDRRLR